MLADVANLAFMTESHFVIVDACLGTAIVSLPTCSVTVSGAFLLQSRVRQCHSPVLMLNNHPTNAMSVASSGGIIIGTAVVV